MTDEQTTGPYQTDLLQDEIDAAKEAEEGEKDFQARVDKHLANTFGGSDSGVWLLGYLMVLGNVFESVFTGNSRTYYLSGAQDFVNGLADMVYQVNPDVYHRAVDMVKTGVFRPLQKTK